MRRNNFIKYLGLINSINMNRVKVVYTALEELQDKVVFVGGAVVSLYADREVLELRPTDDVDVLVEVLNYKERTELEDIVFILEQRSTIWNDLATTDDEVRMYIVMEFLRLKSNPNLREWIDSHVERNVPRATQRIMDEMEKFLVKVF